jgi:hypothetical protein
MWRDGNVRLDVLPGDRLGVLAHQRIVGPRPSWSGTKFDPGVGRSGMGCGVGRLVADGPAGDLVIPCADVGHPGDLRRVVRNLLRIAQIAGGQDP